MREHADASSWFDLSTLREPYRVEGKKTLGYEIAEQLGWTLPDVIIYPTGGGTGLIGMWKAFEELEQLGLIVPGRKPRMVAVQAEGCAPIVEAFDRQAAKATPWVNARTYASGLRVPSPFGDLLILQALRESGGTAIAVSDDEMAKAQLDLARGEGVFACPEGGATLRRGAKPRRLGVHRSVGQDRPFQYGDRPQVPEDSGATRRVSDPGAPARVRDAHTHLAAGAADLHDLDLRGTRTAGELDAALAEAARALPPGAWIRGWGWKGSPLPADAAASHHVFLARRDGHAAWVNGRARAALGLAGDEAAGDAASTRARRRPRSVTAFRLAAPGPRLVELATAASTRSTTWWSRGPGRSCSA
jgi:hypothetical protein